MPNVWVEGFQKTAFFFGILSNPLLAAFVRIDKVVWGKTCLSDSATKSSDGKLLMNGDNTAFILFAKNNVASFLSDHRKPKLLENFDRLRAGDSWKFRHAPELKRWSELGETSPDVETPLNKAQ